MVLVGFVYRSRAWFVFSAVGRGVPSHGVEGNCGVKILFDGGCSRCARADVPPAVRQVVPEVRGPQATVRPVPEVPEALQSSRPDGTPPQVPKLFFGLVRSFESVGGGGMMGLRPLAVAHPHRTALTASCGQAQIGASRSTTSGSPSRPRGARSTGHSSTRPRGSRGAAVDGGPGMRWGCR